MENIEFIPDSVPKGVLNLEYTLFFIILLLVLLVKSVKVLFGEYKRGDRKRRMQIKYFSFGAIIAMAGGILFDIILPWIFNNESFYSLGPLSFVFFIGFTSYAIIKHQLLDIKVVIQRSLIYSMVFAQIIALYLILITVFGFMFSQRSGVTSFFAAAITMVLGIYGVPVIEKYFRRWTDRVFFKDKYDYSEAIFSLSNILNVNIDLDKLLKESAVKLCEILKIKHIVISLPGKSVFLDSHNAASVIMSDLVDNDLLFDEKIYNIDLSKNVCIEKEINLILGEIGEYHFSLLAPIRVSDEMNGFIVLGEKKSGDMFNGEDCNLLKTFSSQAGVAIEKARLYEKVRDYSRDLEKKVEERTAMIKGLQEEQKQMMLEISHGLQTPLTIIKGELHSLEKEIGNKKDISFLEKNLDRISLFIYDMLKLARMENQKEAVKKAEFDMSELFSDLVESFAVITSEQNIALESDIEKNIRFFGSSKEIEELVMNLVSNSVKYIGERKDRKISLVLHKENGTIEFSVADNGIGIKKEKIPLLFSRFYRAGNDGKGTGLGLAICKEIAGHHQGRIEVESTEGEGTRFLVILPESAKTADEKI